MKDKKFTKYATRGAYHWQQIKPSIFQLNAFVLARYQQVVNAIPNQPKLKILDIGCGDAVLDWLIYQKTQASIFGIDSDALSLKFARQQFSRRHAKAKFLKASAYKLPFKNNNFDVIILTEVIEHLVKTHQVLSEIQRVIKSNGLIIITTPVKLSSIPEDAMHVKEFSSQELRMFLKKYFRNVTIKTSHPLWIKKLYLFQPFKFKRFRFEPFKWLINLIVLLFKFNPFLISFGQSTNQIAVCQKPL